MQILSWSIHIRVLLREASGTFFDLLFLVPMLVLVHKRIMNVPQADLGWTFLMAGVAGFSTTLLYRIPLPIQPLKLFSLLVLVLQPDLRAVVFSSIVIGLVLVCVSRTGK